MTACELNKCGLCNLVPREPLITKCGHFACRECWGKLRFLKPLCPVCNSKIGTVTTLDSFDNCFEEGSKRVGLLFEVINKHDGWKQTQVLIPERFLGGILADSVMSSPDGAGGESVGGGGGQDAERKPSSSDADEAVIAEEVVGVSPAAEVSSFNSESAAKEEESPSNESRPPSEDELSSAEYDVVLSLKAAGNTAFQANRFEEANSHYTNAIDVYGSKGGGGVGAPQWEERMKILGNQAESLLRLGKWTEARAAADAVLKADPSNIKGRFRRAKALKGEGTPEQLQEALAEFVKLTNKLGGFQTAAERQFAEGLVREVRGELKAKKAELEAEAAAREKRELDMQRKSDRGTRPSGDDFDYDDYDVDDNNADGRRGKRRDAHDTYKTVSTPDEDEYDDMPTLLGADSD